MTDSPLTSFTKDAKVIHTNIAIIGAGFGGLGLGAKLKTNQLDDFIVFEKGPDVGGIWFWNTYPGCGCDVPSHLYSFSFAPYQNTTVRYPHQPEILAYLHSIVDDFNLRPHLKLNTEITSVRWNGTTGLWMLASEHGSHYTANVVVFAVGQLHRPYLPKIAGHEGFPGAAFHTAAWDHNINLKDAVIAVIGTGSSAAQMVPQLAQEAKQIYVYQRTANWVLPKPSPTFSRPVATLFRTIPAMHTIYRTGLRIAADAVLTPVLTQGWSAQLIKHVARWHLHRQISNTELRRKLTPMHTLGCKRIVIDSHYYRALNRSNVALITEPINCITASGISSGNNTHREVDVIVYATGYRTTEFLVPIEVTGRQGIDLHKQWRNGAEAYLGMTLPQFPNMFLLHGPNTILGHNSNIYMIELQVEYILRWLKTLRRQNTRCAIETTESAMNGYKQWLTSTIQPTVWLDNCHSWYKTAEGRVTNPWPATTQQYRKMTRQHIPGSYNLTPID